jgi:hypothetical protein
MQFTTVAISFAAAILPAAFAAECAGANWGAPNMDVFWTAREVACRGNSKTFDDDRVKIAFYGAGTPNTQLCWDATENILNQCIKDGT